MKRIFLAITVVLFSLNIFSQGFSAFSVEGELQKSVIKNIVDGPSRIEVLVDESMDLTKVPFKYRLLGGCYLDEKISPDFTEPQTITVGKRGVDSKDWIISVKRLQKAPLPFSLKFSNNNPSVWSNEVVGWAGILVDETKETVIRFGNHGVSFIVAVADAPKSVEYELTPVSKEKVKFDGKFVVETSPDGRTWSPLYTFDSKNNFNDDPNYKHELNSDVRYIKWTYTERNRLNINLNKIIVQ